ncbi:unnamed protein product [Larinioides sclopetarius]|uniref:Uncharacterized protein n=1 Tax=Larinioides sclopetarius TaxID=280406 RepID=A0AAV1ZP24_9ARAC
MLLFDGRRNSYLFSLCAFFFLQCLQRRESREEKKKREDCQSEICLIKTEKLGETIDADEAEEMDLLTPQNWFVRFDTNHLKPFFTRRANSKMGSECGSKYSQDVETDWYKNVKSYSGDESS